MSFESALRSPIESQVARSLLTAGGSLYGRREGSAYVLVGMGAECHAEPGRV